MSTNSNQSMHTRVIHGDGDHHGELRGVTVPIYQSSTFVFESAAEGAARFAGQEPGFIYSRLGNPTCLALEETLAQLEGGVAGLATSSGMAAITTVYLALLGSGAHVVSTDAVYGPSRVIIENEFSRFGVTADFVDTSNIENVKQAIRPETKLIYIETPANPTLSVTDIAAVAALAKARNIPLAVDNTFSSPVLQNPIALGADIVVHSLTKFINGHSDVVGGAIISSTKELHTRLKKVLTMHGGTMDPHQAWLVLRGIKTLALRVERAQESAQKIAEHLKNHPKVAWVNYPGLPEHPQHELTKTQMRGFGSMMCFGPVGGYAGAERMINAVKLCTLAVSLGSLETLIQHPASMTHAGMTKDARESSGISDDMIRFSVGCEGVDDLIADLDQALELA